jgi:hypothetical protein
MRFMGSVTNVLGRDSRLDQTHSSWKPVYRMITAAKRDSAKAERRLAVLFNKSRKGFFPDFGDPLDADLGLGKNRWLKRANEMAYSDWLAWILGRQRNPAKVLRLFGLSDARVPRRPWDVDREVPTEYGRPDLWLRDEDLGILCIEVVSDHRETYFFEHWPARLWRRSGAVA